MSFGGFSVNVNDYDHSSLTLAIGGFIVADVEEIGWEVSITRGKRRGTSATVQQFTRGIVDFTGTMKFPTSVWQNIIFPQLIATGLGSPGNAAFSCTLIYGKFDQLPSTLQWEGVRITGESGSSAAGGEIAMSDISVDIQNVRVNGVSYFLDV